MRRYLVSQSKNMPKTDNQKKRSALAEGARLSLKWPAPQKQTFLASLLQTLELIQSRYKILGLTAPSNIETIVRQLDSETEDTALDQVHLDLNLALHNCYLAQEICSADGDFEWANELLNRTHRYLRRFEQSKSYMQLEPKLDGYHRHISSQKKKAAKSRLRKDILGRTLDDLIQNIHNENPDGKPSELWPHLGSAIEEWAEQCRLRQPVPRNPQYLYSLPDGTEKTISFETFKKRLQVMRRTKRK